MAKKIGALRYFECSAVKREGTREIFETILRMVLTASPELRKRYKSGNWRRKTISALQPS
jgi:GTPase SAR1 family protein